MNSNYLNDLFIDWRKEEEEQEWRKEMNDAMNEKEYDEEEEYDEGYSDEDFPVPYHF